MHGPYVSQFDDITARLRAVWAGTEAHDAGGLTRSIEELLHRPELRRHLATEAHEIVRANRENAHRHVALITQALDAADH